MRPPLERGEEGENQNEDEAQGDRDAETVEGAASFEPESEREADQRHDDRADREGELVVQRHLVLRLRAAARAKLAGERPQLA